MFYKRIKSKIVNKKRNYINFNVCLIFKINDLILFNFFRKEWNVENIG